jgi:dTMP kinase
MAIALCWHSMPALFIVLDGPDASGTTTHAHLLAERLKQEGHDVVLTSEPTDGPVGKQIREFLSNGEADPMELQLLFTSDRAWHVKNVIEPALKAGNIVVCDRYIYSTIIYAEAQGLPSAELQNLNKNFIQPNVTILTLPPIEISLQRIKKRADKDIFEREDFQQKVHLGYQKIANFYQIDNSVETFIRWRYPLTRIFSFYRHFAKKIPQLYRVDTSGSKDAAAEKIWGIVHSHL